MNDTPQTVYPFYPIFWSVSKKKHSMHNDRKFWADFAVCD